MGGLFPSLRRWPASRVYYYLIYYFHRSKCKQDKKKAHCSSGEVCGVFFISDVVSFACNWWITFKCVNIPLTSCKTMDIPPSDQLYNFKEKQASNRFCRRKWKHCYPILSTVIEDLSFQTWGPPIAPTKVSFIYRSGIFNCIKIQMHTTPGYTDKKVKSPAFEHPTFSQLTKDKAKVPSYYSSYCATNAIHWIRRKNWCIHFHTEEEKIQGCLFFWKKKIFLYHRSFVVECLTFFKLWFFLKEYNKK